MNSITPELIERMHKGYAEAPHAKTLTAAPEKPRLKFTVLTDNLDSGDLAGEWGLAILIEYGGQKILLDTGASGLFLTNAQKLGIDLRQVDFAVLSHAHYDHANGVPAFLGLNPTAKLYLSRCCAENCYSRNADGSWRYIGMPKNSLRDYAGRMVFTSGRTEIAPGVTLLAHTTPQLERIGEREGLYLNEDGTMVPDSFRHEHSLVLDIGDGLVIFNSCCHAGAPAIIREVAEAFPGRQILGIIGGFHLFNRTDAEVRGFALQVKECGIGYICTGHCTGDRAYEILAEELGDSVHRLHCGLVRAWV